jgi:hypothetical protein
VETRYPGRHRRRRREQKMWAAADKQKETGYDDEVDYLHYHLNLYDGGLICT